MIKIEYEVQYRSVDGSKWINAKVPYQEEDLPGAVVDIANFRKTYPEREFRMVKRSEEVVA